MEFSAGPYLSSVSKTDQTCVSFCIMFYINHLKIPNLLYDMNNVNQQTALYFYLTLSA